jgi:hypothetical protein
MPNTPKIPPSRDAGYEKPEKIPVSRDPQPPARKLKLKLATKDPRRRGG